MIRSLKDGKNLKGWREGKSIPELVIVKKGTKIEKSKCVEGNE